MSPVAETYVLGSKHSYRGFPPTGPLKCFPSSVVRAFVPHFLTSDAPMQVTLGRSSRECLGNDLWPTSGVATQGPFFLVRSGSLRVIFLSVFPSRPRVA